MVELKRSVDVLDPSMSQSILSRWSISSVQALSSKISQIRNVLRNTAPSTLLAEHFQLRFGSERVLSPEVLFDPSLIGSPKAGLGEAIKMFLLRHEENVRTELVQNIFLSGGFSKQRMMSNRIEFEIRQLLPVHSKLRVVTEKGYLFDAWNGAARCVSCLSI